MNISIFDFSNYKLYLNQILKSSRQRGRGLRSMWATAMGCKPAFVSHVFKGSYDLSLEQAESLAHHLALNKEELEYFILLVQKERAGSHRLKKFFLQLIEEALERRDHVRSRINVKTGLSLEYQSIYYSHWLYAAIHILLTIPEYQTSPEKIATYFNKPLAKVREILYFLEEVQLITLKNGRYTVQNTSLYLDKDSALFAHQSIQWKQKTIESIYENHKDNFHFYSLFSISESDIKKIKTLMLKCVEESTEIITPSKEEKLYLISMDLFEAR